MALRAPAFWNDDEPGFAADMLRPFGLIYGYATAQRLKKSGLHLPIPVISVGNFTAGGTGKTPVARALADALLARGERPFIIARGYGGASHGPIRVSPLLHTAREVGDEPLMLAREHAVIIARDRAAGAQLAVEQGADVIILDDALQNPALHKDFSLVLVDGAVGIGNGLCIPAGPMRASLRTLLPHSDAVLIIGEDQRAFSNTLPDTLPRFSARMMPAASSRIALVDRPVIAYCGIGRPGKFHATLGEIGAEVVKSVTFADHHIFSDHDAAHLLALRQELKAELVTTEKDYIRLAGSEALDTLRLASLPVPISITLPDALMNLIYAALDSARRRIKTASGPA